MIKCNKCDSTNIILRKDQRGLPVAYCLECDSRIKNMSTTEVMEYYEARPRQLVDTGIKLKDIPAEAKPICRYCTESWVMKQGRLGNVYREMDIEYCPMCGRKLQPTDKDY